MSEHLHFMIFGLTTWDSFPQREHGLAWELAHQGHQVDVVELPHSMAGRTHELINRIFSPLAKDRGFARGTTPDNLRVHTPPMMPTGFRNTLTPALDRVLFRRWFSDTFSGTDHSTTIAIIMMPLWWGRFLERDVFDPGLLIYDIADSLEVQSRGPRTLGRLRDCEHLLSREADFVTYSAQEMDQEVGILFPGVPSLFLPNAVSRDFIDRVDQCNGAAPSGKPQIGFIGSTSGKWFDAELMIDIVEAFPDCGISIVGPVDKHFAERCHRYPNTRLHGFVAHEELGPHLKQFDVAIIPFKYNGITRVVNPLKLYEYSAAGLPVVSTWTEELSNYEPMVMLARSSAEFIDSIRGALRGDSEEIRVKRRNFALANTWSERVHRLTAMIERQAAEA